MGLENVSIISVGEVVIQFSSIDLKLNLHRFPVTVEKLAVMISNEQYLEIQAHRGYGLFKPYFWIWGAVL